MCLLCCAFFYLSSLARQCAQLWLKTRESLGHPLGVVSEPDHLVCPKDILEAAVRKVFLGQLPFSSPLFCFNISMFLCNYWMCYICLIGTHGTKDVCA